MGGWQEVQHFFRRQFSFETRESQGKINFEPANHKTCIQYK